MVMKQRLKLEIATITIWHIAAIIISAIAFMILYMKANRTASLKAFFYVQFTMTLWMVGKIFKTVSPNIAIRWSFIVFYYAAICLLEVAFLEFGYAYYKGKPIRTKIKMLLYICPIIQFIIILTNPIHHLFYSQFDFRSDDFGILFYVHVIVEYIYIMVGIFFCSIKFNKQFKNHDRWFKYLVVTAILAPIVLNLIYVSGGLKNFLKAIHFGVVFDVTPIVFLWSLLVFVYSTFKYEFFDISPIMKHEIIHELNKPICIMDSAGDVLFINEQLRKSFNIANDLSSLNQIIRENSRELFINDDATHFSCIVKRNEKYYRLYSRVVKTIGGTQYIVVFDDITSYQLIKNQLSQKNDELIQANRQLEEQINVLKQTSHVGARNFVARELHDIIGHALVITMKLLEVSKLYYKKDKAMVLDTLNKAGLSIHSGFDEMKSINASNREKIPYTGAQLERELGKMLKKVERSGIQINFYFRGKIKEIDEKVFDIIKKICTELITNTLKHANASRMLLDLSFTQKDICIHMMDNGLGQEKVVKGNGLKGIETRVELVEGLVTYTTSLNEGFNVNIVIPR